MRYTGYDHRQLYSSVAQGGASSDKRNVFGLMTLKKSINVFVLLVQQTHVERCYKMALMRCHFSNWPDLIISALVLCLDLFVWSAPQTIAQDEMPVLGIAALKQ